MTELKALVEEALFDVRPYVEYYNRLRELVLGLLSEVNGVEALIARLEEEASRVKEPFRTDIRILTMKLRGLGQG
ncbi:hypothetical protein [Pyrococcus yayanosii]|uniref:Uncharacterized protein n=1 Tax=Pyrococcus yayanosii (strain CH1 / JCM 16557) TaxID=529709 RepID=F8AGG0_PYRYC|nr:hypothetical protein [Pyrococcus yayanosii]AEH25158.1 hypothetical protein PYCH_14900 [Pyrococcus yayanosii CH1]